MGGRNTGEDAEMDMWVEALQAAARQAPCREGLRRCSVCGAALATPLRLRDHLLGRRHCLAVAERHLGRYFGSTRGVALRNDGVPSVEDATEVFKRLSTDPLALQIVEPPDVAFVR